MKILRTLLPSLLPLVLVATVSAQKAEGQKAEAECPDAGAKSACCESGAVASKGASKSGQKVDAKTATSQVAIFQKLDSADKKAVAAAFSRLNETCPYGSRLGKTIVMLDKLYADASQNLTRVAQHENCDPALAKDLMAEVKAIGNLRAINAKSLHAARVILSSNTKAAKAGGCCGAEEAKAAKTAQAGCGDEAGCDDAASGGAKATAKAQGGCCGAGESAPKTPAIYAAAQKLTDSWALANKDLQKIDPKLRKQLQSDMKLLSSKGLQLPKMVMASVTAQNTEISKVHAGLSCSTSGLVKKHADLIGKSSLTSQACEASGKALASASALLKASTTALNAPKGSKKDGAKAQGSCCDSPKASKIGQ